MFMYDFLADGPWNRENNEYLRGVAHRKGLTINSMAKRQLGAIDIAAWKTHCVNRVAGADGRRMRASGVPWQHEMWPGSAGSSTSVRISCGPRFQVRVRVREVWAHGK